MPELRLRWWNLEKEKKRHEADEDRRLRGLTKHDASGHKTETRMSSGQLRARTALATETDIEQHPVRREREKLKELREEDVNVSSLDLAHSDLTREFKLHTQRACAYLKCLSRTHENLIFLRIVEHVHQRNTINSLWLSFLLKSSKHLPSVCLLMSLIYVFRVEH
ncbi:hypothetical protein BgiMline_003569 [Biomphalaria glabrata]|nr:hypothetical protein BgiMline_012104 [Biomphalaria glabrata]